MGPVEIRITIPDDAWQATGSETTPIRELTQDERKGMAGLFYGFTSEEGLNAFATLAEAETAYDEAGFQESRLLAGIVINGCPMHLEAFAVNDDNGLQVAADSWFADELGHFQDAQGTAFQTTMIRGREYVLIATPHGT